MQELLKDFVENGPTEKELSDAKQNLLGGYALQFDSNTAICHQVAALGFYELPLDYFNAFKPAIEKITIEDIKHAFQKRVSPTNFCVIMVGGNAPTANKNPLPAPTAPGAQM